MTEPDPHHAHLARRRHVLEHALAEAEAIRIALLHLDTQAGDSDAADEVKFAIAMVTQRLEDGLDHLRAALAAISNELEGGV